MRLSNFSFKKIQLILKKFEQAKNELEAIYYLIELLLFLKEKGSGNERAESFLNKIEEKLEVKLEKTNVEEIKSNIYGLIMIETQNTNGEILKNITEAFDRYEVMFGQMVPMHIS